VPRFAYCYSESRYAEYRYAECRYAECRYAECRCAECHYGIMVNTVMQNVVMLNAVKQSVVKINTWCRKKLHSLPRQNKSPEFVGYQSSQFLFLFDTHFGPIS
jgi:hypothetical protein